MNSHLHDPVARPDSIVTFGQARFTVLTSRMIRLEWAGDRRFEDRASLAAVNRRLPRVAFRQSVAAGVLTIRTADLTLRYKETGRPFGPANLSAEFVMNGRKVRWRFGQKDRGNLGGTLRTLDCCLADVFVKPGTDPKDGRRLPLSPGLVSRDGWVALDDSANIVLDAGPDAEMPWVTRRPDGRRQDVYLLAYGRDYRAALADGARVFGRQPLPPRYAFGYWYSRYWAYIDREIEELVGDFHSAGVPLDVMVIDMDWHLPGWTGYTWDRRYFPNPDEFLRWLKDQKLKITLNLHPADGVGRHEEQFAAVCRDLGLHPKCTDRVPFSCVDPQYVKSYFRRLHHPEEARGVDFWWMDWQQGETSEMKGLDPLPWINQLHWQDMERNPRRGDLRPLCFSRFGGLGAGRYPVGFSGDTYSNWKSLAYQPHFTATAANVLYGYWSHDIGGHMPGKVEPEMFTRWVQFGAFSPVLRTHTSKDPEAERRAWRFPDPYNRILADAIRRRYELVPYIYSECRRTVDSGVSLVHPMYYGHPDAAAAYAATGQFMFGESLMVAPVTRPANPADEMASVDVWLPPGEWFDLATGETLSGGASGRRVRRRYLIDEVPVFARPGTILPGQQPTERLEPGSYRDLVLTIVPGGRGGEYDLYEDDGLTLGYERGESAVIPLSHRVTATGRTITVGRARGSFQGFAKRRSLEVRLPAAAPPRTVKLGAKALAWHRRLGEQGWTYDGQTATVIIRVASIDVTRGATITVVRDPRTPDAMADGLAGLLRRLDRVCRYNNLASPVFPVHPGERDAVDVAQAGNRIGLDPTTFAAEVADLRRNVRRLPAAIAGFLAAVRKRKREKPTKYLTQARGILKTTLAQFGGR